MMSWLCSIANGPIVIKFSNMTKIFLFLGMLILIIFLIMFASLSAQSSTAPATTAPATTAPATTVPATTAPATTAAATTAAVNSYSTLASYSTQSQGRCPKFFLLLMVLKEFSSRVKIYKASLIMLLNHTHF